MRWLRGSARARTAISALAAAVAGVVGLLPGSGAPVVTVQAAGILGAAFVSAWMTWLEDAALVEQQRELREARAVALLTLSDVVEPLLYLVGRVGAARDPDERHALQGQAEEVTVQGLAHAVGGERSRACFFAYTPTSLTPSAYAGRAGGPHNAYLKGTPPGDAMLRIVEQDDYLFVEDAVTAPPLGWVGPKSYSTFIAVSVTAGGRPLGLLTVDAQQPGDLREVYDVPVVQVLARALAAALVQ